MWLRGRDLDWRLSQPGFDSSYGRLVCLATLMSSERTNRSVCGWIYIYIYIMSHRQHRSPWPSLATRFHRPSLPGGFQGYMLYQHRAFVAGCPAFARPYNMVLRSSSLMSSSPLLRQFPICLVRLLWIVFVMSGRWPYNCCFVGFCLQDLFNIARSILV